MRDVRSRALTCTRCGSPVTPQIRFCGVCGAPRAVRSTTPWLLVGCLVLGFGVMAVAGLGGLVWFMTTREEPKPPVSDRQDDTPKRRKRTRDDHARLSEEESAARRDRTDSERLPERWVVPHVIVALDWATGADDPKLADIRESLLLMNRRLYDVTDGQVRIGTFYLMDAAAAAEVQSAGVLTIHLDWEAALKRLGYTFTRDVPGLSVKLGDPSSPSQIHVGYKYLQQFGVPYYSGLLVHEWLHAFVGLGDEYEDETRSRQVECLADAAARADADACVMYGDAYTELCRADGHNTDTHHHAVKGVDCYTELARSINAHAAGRTGDLTIPRSIHHGPSDPPDAAIELKVGGTTPPAAARAAIERVWYEGTETEMIVHAKFTIAGHKERDALMVAHFSAQDGSALRDSDKRYATADGQVATSAALRPGYDDAVYEDLTATIPYSELHLGPGSHALSMVVSIWDATPDAFARLATSERVDFTFQTARNPTAALDGVEVEHNVTDGYGRVGMRIYIEFNVVDMKGVQGYAGAYFYFSDDAALKDYDGSYVDTNGNVSAGEFFTPEYDSTVYREFALFIPYEQMHLRTGILHECRFVVEILTNAGGTWTSMAKSDATGFTVDYRE